MIERTAHVTPDADTLQQYFSEVLPPQFDILAHLKAWKKRHATQPLVLTDVFSLGSSVRSLVEQLSQTGDWNPQMDLGLAVTLNDQRQPDLQTSDQNNGIHVLIGDFLKAEQRRAFSDLLAGRKIALLTFCPDAGYHYLPSDNPAELSAETMPWNLVYLHHWLQFFYSSLDADQGVALFQTSLPFRQKPMLKMFGDGMNKAGIPTKIGKFYGGGSWGAASIMRTPQSPDLIPRINFPVEVIPEPVV